MTCCASLTKGRLISPEDDDKIDQAIQQIQTSGRWKSEKMTEKSETALYDLIEEQQVTKKD